LIYKKFIVTPGSAIVSSCLSTLIQQVFNQSIENGMHIIWNSLSIMKMKNSLILVSLS